MEQWVLDMARTIEQQTQFELDMQLRASAAQICSPCFQDCMCVVHMSHVLTLRPAGGRKHGR